MTTETTLTHSTPLDSIACPLRGCCLVEAAAGTGKTYSIQNLAARLIVEEGLPIAAILVVTFTEAAAAELRDRIRQILQTLLQRAQGGAVPAKEEERTRQLLDHAMACGIDAAQIRERLTLALRDFDDATISTIHGFCQKVLSEFAFESGVLFSSRLEPDLEELYREAAMDYYRTLIYHEENAELINELFAFHNITVAQLLATARKFMERPGLTARTPHGECADTAGYLTGIREGIGELRRLFDSGFAVAWEGMLNKGYELADLEADAAELEAFAAGAPLTGKSWAVLRRLHPDRFREKLKKTGTKEEKAARPERAEALLAQPFFVRLAAWLTGVESYKVALLLEANEQIRERVTALKQRRHVQSFHDLLLRVHQGLHRQNQSLAEALRHRYRAGIVDEFQDTDSLQYEIFERIFGHDPAVPWFMVGDPRQAIYAFRGGDIATYRRADRERAERGGLKRTLTTNYRSAAPMIDAVNRIFAEHACPFADPAIRFEAIQAPESVRTVPAPLPGSALEIYYNPECNTDAMLTECVNRCFAVLHDRDIRLPERDYAGVRPSDIAILVPASHMGLTLQERLNILGIPAVFTRTGNIFGSAEARELQTLLEAVLAPSRGDLVIRALATAVGGYDLAGLIRLQQNGIELAGMQERFQYLSQLWHRRSFIEMFQTMLREFEVLARFPRLDTGERQLTNLLQLGDLLQQQSRRRELSPRSLVHFLNRAIADSADSQPEEYEQLLETDRAAVKIMTVHASKGLEFPLVFLPAQFAWHAQSDNRLDVYHNAAGAAEYDLGADPEAALRYQSERLQELLRLAYVAVTRAKYRCTIFWGKYGRGRGERSCAWDWLFRMRDFAYSDDYLSCLLQCEREPEIPAPYRIDAAPVPPAGARYRFTGDHEIRLELPALSLQLDRGWQITSYSGLTRNAAEAVEDYDDAAEDVLPAPEEQSDADIFDFPGGTQTGSAWHKILESIDFTASSAEWAEPVRRTLDEYGLRSGRDRLWRENRTLQLLADVLQAPLMLPDRKSLRLAELPRDNRLNELEFHFGIRHGFTQRDLYEAVAAYARERFAVATPRWNAPDVTGGYLNGIVDLIFEAEGRFYLADWKSNRLQAKWSNFAVASLPEVMGESGYILQYLLYSVALVKYLRLRLGGWDETLWEKHFGGVWYCFLRGMTPEVPGRGVFFDRPGYQLLNRLETLVG